MGCVIFTITIPSKTIKRWPIFRKVGRGKHQKKHKRGPKGGEQQTPRRNVYLLSSEVESTLHRDYLSITDMLYYIVVAGSDLQISL